jgi:hypothetical protein
MTPLPRTVKYRMTGIDIDGHGHAMHKYLHDGQTAAYLQQKESMRQTFGIAKRTLAKKCAKKAGLPEYGVVGPNLYKVMYDAGAYRGRPEACVQAYIDAQRPKLIEPNQGWDSLHVSLWKAYSLGRSKLYGFSDLGTWNPASRLPSGAPSDHSVHPAFAFDLGIDPDTGWSHLKARAYVYQIAGWAEIEYVILGDRIWTDRGLGRYHNGGHMNHIHVSGNR